MAPFETPVRRLLIAGGFAIAIAAAPAVAAVAVPSLGASTQACSSGEEEDVFTGVCVPHTVPSSPAVPATGTTPGLNDAPSVDGVACEGRNDAQCRGLAEEQQSEGPAAQPKSTVDGTPRG
jgi:hypothetical protein